MDGKTQSRGPSPKSLLCALCVSVAILAACGTPPNQRVLTRTDTYLKAMVLGFESGQPLDVDTLVRKFPELKDKVITAPQWIEEYDRLRREAEARGTAVFEYRIPNGANITIEVLGEKDLTRHYTVPPTGYVHYPHLERLKVVGLTPDELKRNLERELSVYLQKPQVLVHVNATPYQTTQFQPFFEQSFGGAEIVVLGIARTRFLSNLAYTGKETLLAVLGNSDLPEIAEWRQIRVIRRDPKDPLRRSRVILCDLWDYFAKGDIRQDIPLAPGDVVFVPRRWTVDDQFWEDWDYTKRIINDVFFIDNFKDAMKKGGQLRN